MRRPLARFSKAVGEDRALIARVETRQGSSGCRAGALFASRRPMDEGIAHRLTPTCTELFNKALSTGWYALNPLTE